MVRDTKFYDALGVSVGGTLTSFEFGADCPQNQVDPAATEAELKKAYRVGALKHHPGMHLKCWNTNYPQSDILS